MMEVRARTTDSMIPRQPAAEQARTVAAVMRTVVLALLPGIAVYAWAFGWGVLVSVSIACAASYVFEAVMLWVRGKPFAPFLTDLSVLVTALLLALALPPLAPWWIPVVGSFFAVVVAKHLYGGLGYNTFNPAMAGYAVLMVSFPLQLSQWPAPLTQAAASPGLVESICLIFSGQLPAGLSMDTLTGATVLDHLRTGIARGDDLTVMAPSAVFGHLAGAGYEWVNLAFLVGGLWLVYRRVVSWHIPFSVLATLATTAALFHLLNPQQHSSALLHLFGGASILGAFFIATDPVTAAASAKGKLIYGAGIGFLIYAIRSWGAYPDGIAFAVLLMGLAVPLIDQYTQPKVFGERRRQDERH